MISVGIDIGKNSIKIAEIQSVAKIYTLTHFKEYPLSNDPAKDTQFEIIDILRNVVSQYDTSVTKFSVGIPQNRVSVRRTEFPFRERHKVLKSLAFELEDDIPFSQEDAVFDAKITHYAANSAHVLAVACPIEYIQNLLNTCKDGGFEPDIVSVEGLAFSNLFEDWQAAAKDYDLDADDLPEAAAAEIIVDLGHTTTLVAVYRDGLLLEVRTIDWGGKDLANAVANANSIHYLEAVKELKVNGEILPSNEGATTQQIKMSDTLKKSLDDLLKELNLTLLEIKSEHNIEYKRSTMVGGVSQLKNIGLYITQKTEIPTNKIKSLRAIPHLEFQLPTTNEGIIATSVGLAIEGFKRPINPPINLLKGDLARQSQSMNQFWETWAHSLKVAAACFVVLMVYGILKDSFSLEMSNAARDNLKTHATKITGYTGRKANARNSKKYIKKQNNIQKQIKAAEGVKEYNSAMDILKQISQLKPSPATTKINVKKFKVTNEKIHIEGEVSMPAAIKSLKNSLKGISKGGKVKALAPTIRAQKGWKGFAFDFRVERKPGSSM